MHLVCSWPDVRRPRQGGRGRASFHRQVNSSQVKSSYLTYLFSECTYASTYDVSPLDASPPPSPPPPVPASVRSTFEDSIGFRNPFG